MGKEYKVTIIHIAQTPAGGSMFMGLSQTHRALTWAFGHKCGLRGDQNKTRHEDSMRVVAVMKLGAEARTRWKHGAGTGMECGDGNQHRNKNGVWKRCRDVKLEQAWAWSRI